MKNSFVSILRLLPSLMLAIIAGSCANEMAPTGGKTDSEPPKPVFSNPANEAVNVRTSKVILRFDEYLQAGGFQKTIISPAMKTPPVFKVKGKELWVEFKDTLKPNVTYRLFFDEDLRDNNEGNILQDFSLAFSTGPDIDTARLEGKVSDAQSGKAADRVWVGLYNEPEEVLSSRPLYVCRTNASGAFKLSNVKPGTYYLRAFRDEDNSLSYNQPNEEIAFYTERINVSNDSVLNLSLSMFLQEPESNKIKTAKCESNGNLLIAAALKFKPEQIRFSKPMNYEYWFNETGDSAVIFPEKTDSLRFKVFLTENGVSDSARIDCRKSLYDTATVKRTYPLLVKNQSVTNKKEDKWPVFKADKAALDSFEIRFPVPISGILKPEAIKILKDSVMDVPLNAITTETGDRRKMNFNLLLEPGAKYFCIVPEGSIRFYNQSVNGAFILQLNNGKAEDYGSLTIRLESGLNAPGSYLIKVLKEDGSLYKKYALDSVNNTIIEKSIPSGSYTFEVISDVNQNGKWDTGKFKKGIQPERIFRPAKAQVVKAGWQQEVTLKPE